MFPLCFVHGVHGIRPDDRYGDHPIDAPGGRATPGRRLVVACLTIGVSAAVSISGCDTPERTTASTASATSGFTSGAVSGADLDAFLDTLSDDEVP